ncbi:hypothetical protein D1AOALGA4SA_10237 [Olavius algarvensis Delta 1 endosymbiont]|nr:hypothetical protein D1AOALGA4SA_10237 [Olavius algarvensis Delta 1 endosymbiont]
MTKRKTSRKKRGGRKRHNSPDFMPEIQPDPTLHEDNIDKLPKILIDCQAKLDDGDINKIRVRLNFVDHKDLRKLNGIRVVDPGTIQMPSKEPTIGCYHPANKSGQAEIWLSSCLINTSKGFETFFDRMTYKDKLFETLFHEIGNHKASLTHSVDKFENEAFAEKYMLAYKKFWKRHHGPSKIYIKVFRYFIKLLRFILIGILYPFKNRNKEINHF